jgi:hypothetical protein
MQNIQLNNQAMLVTTSPDPIPTTLTNNSNIKGYRGPDLTSFIGTTKLAAYKIHSLITYSSAGYDGTTEHSNPDQFIVYNASYYDECPYFVNARSYPTKQSTCFIFEVYEDFIWWRCIYNNNPTYVNTEKLWYNGTLMTTLTSKNNDRNYSWECFTDTNGLPYKFPAGMYYNSPAGRAAKHIPAWYFQAVL